MGPECGTKTLETVNEGGTELVIRAWEIEILKIIQLFQRPFETIIKVLGPFDFFRGFFVGHNLL